MIIKFAKNNDEFTNEILSLEQQIFDETFRYSQNQIKSILSNKNYDVILCYENKNLVGYCILLKSDKIDIDKIGIVPEYQKNGFGTKIIDMLKEKYKKQLILEVSENNLKAISFYKKNGFKIIGKRKAYYSNGDNAIIMLYEI